MRVLDDAARWLRRYHPADPAAPRLLCFPHAGGAASAYFALSAALAPAIEVTAVQYPGRQDRGRENPIEGLTAVADDVARLLEDDGRPYALFGHSMGALIAFEAARRLERLGGRGPDALFASAHRDPGAALNVPTDLDDASLVALLDALSGTDDAIIRDEALLELVLPALRGDYRALGRYRYEPGPALRCPLIVALGDADPEVSPVEARRWARFTEASCAVHVFPGGHFYLQDRLPELAELVRSVCLSAHSRA